MSGKGNSPFKIEPMTTMAIIGAGAKLGMGIWGKIKADKAAEELREKEKTARQEMERLKGIYANLDTSNPFLNMDNKFEDLTINQKAADYQRQQFQQRQSNILGGLRGAAGGSGIAALAQSLSQQGQLASQKASADIAAQEQRNQMLRQQEASRLQGMERQGEIQSRNWERDKTSTLLGMAQQETAAYGEQAQQAAAAGWEGLTSAVGGVADMAMSGLTPSAPEGYSFELVKDE